MVKRGMNAERELVNKLYDIGYAVVRAPASGGATTKMLPDILASNGKHTLVIEVKTNKNKAIYIRGDQIEGLKWFASKFNGTPLIAVKFKYGKWRFVPLNMLRETKKCFYVVDRVVSDNQGYSIETFK